MDSCTWILEPSSSLLWQAQILGKPYVCRLLCRKWSQLSVEPETGNHLHQRWVRKQCNEDLLCSRYQGWCGEWPWVVCMSVCVPVCHYILCLFLIGTQHDKRKTQIVWSWLPFQIQYLRVIALFQIFETDRLNNNKMDMLQDCLNTVAYRG